MEPRQEEGFTAMDSFKLIESMVGTARNQMTENGHLYLLWGWVIFVCSVGQFLMQQVYHTEKFWMIWLLTWAAAIYQVVFIRRKVKRIRVRTYSDEIIKYIWIVFVIMMAVGCFVVSNIVRMPGQVNILILLLYGMPTFLSGIVIRFRPLIVGGSCCWALAITAIFVPVPYYMLLIAAAVVVAWIVPGYLLQIKYKKINSSYE
ncbi:MAG: hypothetical protein ABIX01_19375 [Chitinophagaceae bacterium]